jgi:hypothetical protein
MHVTAIIIFRSLSSFNRRETGCELFVGNLSAIRCNVIPQIASLSVYLDCTCAAR